MSKFEYRIPTKVGELIIYFDTMEEFQARLKDIDMELLIKSTKEELGTSIQLEVRQPKPGFEDVYRLTGDGYVELLKVPSTKIDTIGLVLYAFDPSPGSFNQIARSSGVADPSVYLSTKNYQKYFDKTKDGYLLTQEGKAWILKDVVSKLEAPPGIR